MVFSDRLRTYMISLPLGVLVQPPLLSGEKKIMICRYAARSGSWTNFLARDFGRLGVMSARPLSSRHGPSCPTRRTSGCWYTKGQSRHDRQGGRGSSRRRSGMHIVTACACAAPLCQKMLNALLCLLAHTMTCSPVRSCNAGASLWLAAAEADHQARRFPPPR